MIGRSGSTSPGTDSASSHFTTGPERRASYSGRRSRRCWRRGKWRLGWTGTGLHEYLYYNTALGARTLYAGVRKLLPGHKLTLHAESGLNIEQYGSIFDVEPVGRRFSHGCRAGTRAAGPRRERPLG